jgi:hypothetical protein
MHVVVFSTLGQSWLARSIQSSQRSKPKTYTGGSLLPQAAPLLLPRARRWEALAATASLLLPHARRRLHPMTPLWRCGRWLLLLRQSWRRLHLTTLPRPPWATTMSAPRQRGELIWSASRFQMFSIITKCICSFSYSKVRKQIGFSQERISASKEGQPSTDSIYPS